MGYSGYEQYMCPNGHYWTKDAYECFWSTEEEDKCPTCGEKAIWWNAVDLTNGSYELDDEGNMLLDENGEPIRSDNYVEVELEDTGYCCPHCKKEINPDIFNQRRYKLPPKDVGHHIGDIEEAVTGLKNNIENNEKSLDPILADIVEEDWFELIGEE